MNYTKDTLKWFSIAVGGIFLLFIVIVISTSKYEESQEVGGSFVIPYTQTEKIKIDADWLPQNKEINSVVGIFNQMGGMRDVACTGDIYSCIKSHVTSRLNGANIELIESKDVDSSGTIVKTTSTKQFDFVTNAVVLKEKLIKKI